MNYTLEEIIAHLRLEPHPEGGFYRETYRCENEIPGGYLDDRYGGNRHFSTCIYFLMTSDNFSAFHRISQDEIWHFYYGAPIRLHEISAETEYADRLIGMDLLKGQTPQYVVKGGNWFAAEVEKENAFSLIGCTVSPGFHFDDFELAPRKKLLEKFPEHKEIITRLTRE